MKHISSKKNADLNLVVWILTFIISTALIITGHNHVSKGSRILSNRDSSAKATVTTLGEYTEDKNDAASYVLKTQFFTAKITSGEHKGESVTAYQQMDNYTDTGERFVKVSDKVILYHYEDTQGISWHFGNYARFDYILVLGLVFLVLLVVFGKGKGVSTIVSLAFTCFAVFYVFIPAVLGGHNIYLWSVIICVFTIIMTLLLTNGISAKSVMTMLGCASGVTAAALITIASDKIMHLTGVIDEHSIYLQIMNEEGGSINLRALIFSMITIGAMGAVMDVAMDISSSLYEVSRHAPGISFKDLFKSGMNIGRDVMGTMANTLVLAYIGSSLCSILLKISYSGSLLELLNTESITVELLQALAGSLGILLTIPLTALICCFAYCGKGSRAESEI